MSLELALKIAEANQIEKLPRMSAVITKRNKIMSVGVNSHKTHPLQKRFARNPQSLHLHAEIAALKNALRKFSLEELSGATIYVARVLKDGSPALAKPCLGCEKALMEFGIKHVHWTK